MLNDLRYALRLLRSRPLFTATALLSLALGIGLNTSVFSVVNALLLRPAAVERPEEMVEIFTLKEKSGEQIYSSYQDYLDLRRDNPTFTDVLARSFVFAFYDQGGRSRMLIGETVSANYFDLLGVEPRLGRAFAVGEDAPGSEPVAVVSDRFWRQELGGDPAALGREVRLNGQRYSVVGALPPSFTGLVPALEPELWVTLATVEALSPFGMQESEPSPGDTRLERRGMRFLGLRARLAPGATLEEAQAILDTRSAALAQEYPQSNRGYRAQAVPAEEVRLLPAVDRMLAPAATVLLVVVGLVLFVACANVANMLLTRAAGREREVALRLAVGADRWQLLRQLLTESLVLGLGGGVLGLGLAVLVNRALSTLPTGLPFEFTLDLSLDGRVLVFTLSASLLTVVVFGLAPALRGVRTQPADALRQGGIGGGRRGRRLGLGDTLVVAQVAVALMLLVGAGLFVRSLGEAARTDLGLDVDRIGFLTYDLEMLGYDETSARTLQEAMGERVRALPEVESVSFALRLPFEPNYNFSTIWIDGVHLTKEEGIDVHTTSVSADWYQTAEVEIVQGRGFGTQDTPDTPRVAIVNRAFVDQYLPGGTAVGTRFHLQDPTGPEVTIVGVSENHKVNTVGESQQALLQFARDQKPSPYGSLVFRSRGDAEAALPIVRRTLIELEPELTFMFDGAMSDHVRTTLLPQRAASVVLIAFGGLAILLAAVGLYGLIGYWVAQRVPEIGLRMALGADRGSVSRWVLKRGLLLTGLGAVIGVTGALVLSRVLSSALIGVGSSDPLALAVAVAVVLGFALVASLLPALRASRLDPLVALRKE